MSEETQPAQTDEQKAALAAIVEGCLSDVAPLAGELMPRIVEFAEKSSSAKNEWIVMRDATNLGVAISAALGTAYAKGYCDAKPGLLNEFNALDFFKGNIDAMLKTAKPELDALVLQAMENDK